MWAGARSREIVVGREEGNLPCCQISSCVAAAGSCLNFANDGETRDKVSEPHEQFNVPVPVGHLRACLCISVEDREAYGLIDLAWVFKLISVSASQ